MIHGGVFMKNTTEIQWEEFYCREQKAQENEIIIFGASGDLASRKLFPALYSLYKNGLLHKNTRITGCARHPYTSDSFREFLADTLFQGALSGWEKEFLHKISYHVLDYTKEEDFHLLAQTLLTEEKKNKPFLFYLALPSPLYPQTVKNLHDARLLSRGNSKRRIVFEKPFGFDLESSRILNNELKKYLTEEQIYRIDHYLGKETVQNIFLLRFANRIFEPLWNSQHVAEIQITAAETLGVEKRAGYFDKAGILRDMFQNHLLEMLALVTMECPYTFSPDAVRDEKVKLIRSIRPLDVKKAVRAQYDGYTEEEGVAKDSRTETFAALRLFIDNWRWQNVPIYLRAGKKLGNKKTEIDIIFKEVPHSIFPGIDKGSLQRNILHLHVQPQEGIGLTLEAKKPGPKLCMGALTLSYDYEAKEENGGKLDAYARLLLDCQNSDQTLFIRSDVIESAWLLYQDLLSFWQNDTLSPIPRYPQNSDGPREAEELLKEDHTYWIDSLS